jgi:SAM-dependent methyltransferase
MDREYRGVRRTLQEKCWCGGELRDFKPYPNFGVCAECGCYVNRRPPLPESLKDVYTLRAYWRVRQEMQGYPTIDKRGELYKSKSDGRLEFWLSIMERFAPRTGQVIEIGCSPGVLLAEMQRRGYSCLGVEPDQETAHWIRRTEGVEVIAGFFPGVSVPQCDLFMAFDVAEHIPDPVKFWKGISEVLKPDGVAILQTPIECSDFEKPFKGRDFFDDMEHFFLFTESSVRKLASSANLQIIALEDAMISAGSLGQICILKKSSDQ